MTVIVTLLRKKWKKGLKIIVRAQKAVDVEAKTSHARAHAYGHTAGLLLDYVGVLGMSVLISSA
jgi:hypothetical protein